MTKIVKALKCAMSWNAVVTRPELLEELYDGDALRELEQMVDQGDAGLEDLVGIYPFTHKLHTGCGAWWLVIVREG